MRHGTRFIHKYLWDILRLSIKNMAVLILNKDGKLVLEVICGNGLIKQTKIDSVYEGKDSGLRRHVKNGNLSTKIRSKM